MIQESVPAKRNNSAVAKRDKAARKEDIPKFLGGYDAAFNPVAKKTSHGHSYRPGVGHFARGMAALDTLGGTGGMDITGQSQKTFHQYDRMAKAYMGKGGSWKKGQEVAKSGNRYLGRREAKIVGGVGGLAGGVAGGALGWSKAGAGGAALGAIGGAIGGGGLGAGAGYGVGRINPAIAHAYYRMKAKQIRVKGAPKS